MGGDGINVSARIKIIFICASARCAGVRITKAEGDSLVGVGPVAKAGGDVAKVVGVESATTGKNEHSRGEVFHAVIGGCKVSGSCGIG